jgi:hypothetical protein
MPCGALILVAKEPVSAAGVELPEWSNRAVSKNVVPLTGDREFESVSLQRRVINEPVLALGSRYDEISIFA